LAETVKRPRNPLWDFAAICVLHHAYADPSDRTTAALSSTLENCSAQLAIGAFIRVPKGTSPLWNRYPEYLELGG